MKTLKENYKKNVEILKENLKRGMGFEVAKINIDNMERSFINAKVYDNDEKDFINEMRKVLIEKFTNLEINLIK